MYRELKHNMEGPVSHTPTPKPSVASSGIELDASHSYQIRPKFENKFRPQAVKEQIRIVLNEELGGKTYNDKDAQVWSKTISDTLRTKMKEMNFERYKVVVQTVIGEQHGEGVKMGMRCLWDSDTDTYASDVFINDSMFCVAAVYGVYFY